MTESRVPLPPYAAVIFDFDGVIVDSTPLHIRCWEIAHERLYSIPLPDSARMVGKSGSQIARQLAATQGQEANWRQLYHLKSELLYEREGTIPFVPGVRQFILGLQTAGVPYGIGSNARRRFIEQILETAPELRFQNIVSVDDVKRPKPHPDVFENCALLMGIPYEQRREILVFEDSPIGITAAIAGGMTPVGVTTQLNRNVLYNAGARHFVPNFLDAGSDLPPPGPSKA